VERCTYIALKSTGLVDGEDENDVFTGFESFFKDRTVLKLSCPDRLIDSAFRLANVR